MEDIYDSEILIEGYSKAIINEIKNIKVLPSSGIWWLRFEIKTTNRSVKKSVSKIVKEKTGAIITWESEDTIQIKL